MITAQRAAASLWECRPLSYEVPAGQMWNPPDKRIERTTSPEPPAKNLRLAQRLISLPLRVSSSHLWSKAASGPSIWPSAGLWGSRQARPVSIRTRPLTQRPPRKSKQVIFLADISTYLTTSTFAVAKKDTVEDPVPLSNKRDTLGIFRFP